MTSVKKLRSLVVVFDTENDKMRIRGARKNIMHLVRDMFIHTQLAK